MTFQKFRRKKEQGQTMAEFTLVLPMLAILLFIWMQVARQGLIGMLVPSPSRPD